uniref:Ig-like domain-containing protein n=1 Tax=Takifugu rubripes TaxID=31033 RepID=A0A674P5R7_TAKRU
MKRWSSNLLFSTSHTGEKQQIEEKLLLLSVPLSSSGLLNCSSSTSSPHPPKPESVITMDCNLGTVNNYASWYKQVPGGVPQYVLSWYHSWSSVTYGSGFSSPRFTSTHQSTSDHHLMINNLEEGDSAVYYCETWDGSASEYVSQ